MSHQTVKKKRLKTTQNARNLPKKSQENSHSNILVTTDSRITGNKFKTDKTDHVIPLKKSKNSSLQLLQCPQQLQDLVIPGLQIHKDLNYNATPVNLSIARPHQSFVSFKNNKSDIFSNITASFDSSKILSAQVLSNITSQKRHELSSWGLPPLIVEKYEARGIKSMFAWQVECLANKKILEDNKNLVYSAPTSAGKTLVAEFLMLKTVLERRKKAIFILPFVSVVREKMFYFQDLLSDSGVRVEGFMGGVAPPGGFSSVHIAIATIEKANSIINRLMEDGDLMSLGAVVIDELHLLGDPGRGYILELLLTKLKYMSMNLEHVKIQLIGMSATLPNLPLIADWLDAELYKTDFRPIPLNEQCKIGLSLYDSKLSLIRELEPATDIVSDTDNIIQLCIETINGGHGVLIFCPTKNWCEKLSTQMASTFFQLGRDNTFHGQILRKNIDLTAVQEILAQLEHCPVGLDNVLKRTVSFGVAFHHAGLTMDERDIIEGGFRIGSLKVLIATSTLSSGVNLPARRVIVRSPMFNGRPLDKLTYQQMIGRAGRMGKDTEGESILVCKANERTVGGNLMSSSLEPIESCLEDSAPLIRALLEAIASQVVRSPRDLDLYSKCTFVFKCASNQVKEMVEEAVKFLISNEFLLLKDSEEGKAQRMVATCLGKACLSASIPPREGLFLFEELQRARKCFVLDTELHVIYLVTPFNAGSQISQIDWMAFVELWRSLSESERRVGQLVGVEERFLMAAVRGIVKPGKTLNIHRRFFTAMALHDLVREVPLNTVCKKYNCNRGLLQSLQQSSSTFAGMVTNFCKELKWDCMELLFAQFQTRLQFGVSRDLLDLLRLPSLNGLRARSLYKHGITTVAELALANELEVEEALNKALPFESEKDFDGETAAEIAKKTKMRTVFITGKDGMTARDAADVVIKEARVLVQNELGIHAVQWSQANKSSSVSVPDSPNLLSIVTPASFSSIQDHPKVHENSGTEKTVDEPVNVIREENFNANVDKCLSISHENLFTSTDEANGNERAESPKPRTTVAERLSRANEQVPTTSERIISQRDNHQPSSQTRATKHIKNTRESFLHENHVIIRTQDFLEKTSSPNPPVNEAKSLLTSDCVTIRSQELLENVNSRLEEQSKANDDQAPESFLVSDRALDEMMQAVEKQNNKNINKVNEEANYDKQRTSAGSNCTKSPSIFSDSSFLDPQICSILEQNVVDPSCFADFEKSNFTQQQVQVPKAVTSDTSVGVFKKPIATPELASKNPSFVSETPPECNSNKNNVKQKKSNYSDKSTQKNDCKPATQPLTWVEDSWDQTKNLPINETKGKDVESVEEENQSPSLLQTCRMKTRLKTISATRLALDKIQASTNQHKSSLVGSPKSILCTPELVGKNLNFVDQTPPDCNSNKNNVKQHGFPDKNSNDTSNVIIKSKQKNGCVPSATQPLTWVEDSWDQTKNLPINETKNKDVESMEEDKQSPSLLQTYRMKTRLKTISATRVALDKIQASTNQHKSPLVGSPKSILRHRVFDKMRESPIKSVRSYETGNRPCASSTNKSDSDESILNSQSPHRTIVNKTRSRIEKKLIINTQKLFKSQKIKDLQFKYSIEPKLVKRNANFDAEGDSSDSEDADSIEIFDSDDTASLKEQTLKKNKKRSPLVDGSRKPLGSDSHLSAGTDAEKIGPQSIVPINVANSRRTFRMFRQEIESSLQSGQRSDLAMALVTEPYLKEPAGSIGQRIIGIEEKKKKDKKPDAYIYGNWRLSGVVVSWGVGALYYMPFTNTQETKITIKERINFLRDILTNASFTVRCFNVKDVYKMLYTCCNIEPCCNFLDPKTGDWLLNSDTCNKSLIELTTQYFPKGLDVANAYENNCGTRALTGSTRAAAKVLLAWYIVEAVLNAIKQQSLTLLQSYKEIEMPTILILASMELRGFGINTLALRELSAAIKNDLSRAEEEAYRLAGKKFNFYSTKEVSQVLGLVKRGRGCTNKNALKSCENPISNLVTLWRKLSTVQTKIVYPLLQLEKKNERIHGNCITYTVTGRVSMHEPNLQTIPRDFTSEMSGCILSVRMAFVPAVGNVMLSADFCQLELRILAHFSKDPILCKLLHEQGDIFKNIAARLEQVTEERVNDDMRQRAKQLCYAMIYGMGVKSLAESLSVSESDAKEYLETFMGTYKGIRTWLRGVVEQARLEGSVSTLTGRRRVLPGINSKISSVKSQAERQAANTKVQGSAADITKKAMVLIETKLKDEYTYMPLTFPTTQVRRKLRSSDADSRPRGAYLILQLHDELLYEVNSSDLQQVASIVKESMENAFQLCVPLPVKIKVGTAWGNLEEYQV